MSRLSSTRCSTNCSTNTKSRGRERYYRWSVSGGCSDTGDADCPHVHSRYAIVNSLDVHAKGLNLMHSENQRRLVQAASHCLQCCLTGLNPARHALNSSGVDVWPAFNPCKFSESDAEVVQTLHLSPADCSVGGRAENVPVRVSKHVPGPPPRGASQHGALHRCAARAPVLHNGRRLVRALHLPKCTVVPVNKPSCPVLGS